MKFSLVLATVGRTDELARFLAALSCQPYHDFEVVVVDQNSDDRVVRVLEGCRETFLLRHLRSTTGLSRARNVGLRAVRGDLVAFPDDDCWYPPELLAHVARHLHGRLEWDGIMGRSVDAEGRPSAGRWDGAPGPITRFNVWRRATSYTMFLRHGVVETVGEFDESLGLGAGTPWRSGEETDYLLRALKAGFRLYYDPLLAIHHPEPARADPGAVRAYGMGMGRVLRKHRYPAWFVAYQCLRPMTGAVRAALSGDRKRAGYHLAVFKGRVLGWCR